MLLTCLMLLITATGFVFPNQYPVPDALDVHFDSLLKEVSRTGPGFELVKKLTIKFGEGDGALEARVGMFLFRGGVGSSETQQVEQLYFIKRDTYWIEWRISSFPHSPTDLGGKVYDLIQGLLPRN